MLLLCNSYLFFIGVCSLILIAVMSVSICWNTAENFGLLVCMRLLLASAMFNASMIISISVGFKLYIVYPLDVRYCTRNVYQGFITLYSFLF